jgi:hypothetical protein
MTDNHRNTDLTDELQQAVRRYIIARESAIKSEGHYHAMRHALRRCEGENGQA